jgi:hypothetical protein
MRVAESYTIKPDLVRPLMALYEFESRSVNNGLNIGRDFSVEWTFEDLQEIVIDADCPEESASQLLEDLNQTNRIVKLFSEDGSVRAYRTDTAELVRLSTFNYNRYPEKNTDRMISTQSGVTWGLEAKMTPKWSISISDAASKLQSEIANGWIDENGNTHSYQNSNLSDAIAIVASSYDAVQRRKFGSEGMLSGFQFRSARTMLRGMYSTGDKTLAVTAGTGSGKSYGFQIGTLIAIVEQRLAGTLNKTHSIFLYPRVALMDDQRNTMEELLENCNKYPGLNGKEIRWVTDGGSNLKKDYKLFIDPSISDKKLEKLSAPKLIKAFYGSDSQCPHLVFANADTITNRMTSYDAIDGLTSQLQNVVFDEIHLLESITGANTAGVIRRLCAHANRKLMLTGSSATIAEPKDHLGKVFARNLSEVIVVKPDDEEKEMTGIIHHVLHKGIEGSSFKTNLVNLTSLVSHQRRRRITEDESDPSKCHKTIGFADSLNLIGSWEFMLRDNEGLELRGPVMKKINSGLDASDLFPESMPLAFRFDKPLIHLSQLIDSLDEDEAKNHCNSCISGGYNSFHVEDSSIFQNLPLDPFRHDKMGIIDELYDGPVDIGVTDKCPYFECGACWREEENYEPIPLYDGGPIVYSNSIRPIRLTSQSIQDKKREIEMGAELEHFSIKLDEYHYLKDKILKFGKTIENNQQIADVALSSPAIEVGMDFDNALDAVMFKAIRNVSAYRQKVGRLGRERFRDVYSSMLTSFRAVDYHYYRNPAQLLNSNIKEPISLNVDNESVRKQIAYMAVYDDIAKNGGLLARNLHNPRAWDLYTKVVNAALDYLNTEYKNITKRLSSGLKEQKISICENAVDKVIEHLNLLVRDISNLLQGDSTCLADRIGKKSTVYNPTYNSGMQNLYLSNEGNSFLNIATNFDLYLKEIALNRHFDDGKSEEVTKAIDMAVKIWDNFEKGRNDPDLGLFIEHHVEEIAMKGFSIPNLGIEFMKGLQYKQSLESNPDFVKSLIYDGEIPLARTFTDWITERKKGASQFSIWYLRDLFSALHFTKHDLPFVFQKTLFKPPNEKTVAVYVPRPSVVTTEGYDSNTVDLPLREILFAHAPGMWNYRRASMPMKTSCYKQLQPTENHTHMNMPLNNIAGEAIIKHQFIKRSQIQEKDIPWSFNLNSYSSQIDLYEPEKIQLRISRGLKGGNEVIKGGCWNDNYVLIKDGDDADDEMFTQHGESDEDGETEKEKNNINVPECYPIGWRAISEINSQPMKPFNGPFNVEFEDDILRRLLFDKSEFCVSAFAKEYILGNTRKYQGGGELEIQYVDNKVSNNNAVIGHEYQTQGIRFVVSKSTLHMTAEWTKNQTLAKSGSHTTYQSLQYVLSKNLGINRFVVDSLMRLNLYKLGYQMPNNMEDWLSSISELSNHDMAEFRNFWESSTMKNINLDSLQIAVEKIVANPSIVSTNSAELTTDWAVRTYSNSLAIHMLQAAREFSGSRDDDLGYHVECEAGVLDDESEIVIWLYDRSPDGNGSCDTIKQWMQIPKIVRDEYENSKERVLPSKDYIGVLEYDYLVPCDAHQADVIAFACHEENVDPEDIYHGLKREFSFTHSRYSKYWKRLQEMGYSREDYPFVKLIIPFLVDNLSEQEFFSKAVGGCHSSCVECLEEFGISMFGPLDGPNFANKRMISHVLTQLMHQNEDDYRQSDVSMSGAGAGIKGIGTFDPTKPLTADIGGKTVERFAKLHPDRMWPEVDTENPFGEHGQVKSKFWTKMRIDRWSDGQN